MVKGAIKLMLAAALLGLAGQAGAVEVGAPIPVQLGGRMEYDLRLRRDGSTFPWNWLLSTVV